MKEGKKQEYSERTLNDVLKIRPHTKAHKSRPSQRIETTLQQYWEAGKVDEQTPLLCVVPDVEICLLVHLHWHK